MVKPLGYIPGPVDLSPVKAYYQDLRNRITKGEIEEEATALAPPPTSYDLRTTGKLTPVENQGSCGDCWAYATMASLESYLMPFETWTFSEADLNANNGFDFGSCNGGNEYMSMAYLSRYSGPVTTSGGAIQKHMQKAEFFPATPYTFPEIKNAIMTYGGLWTAFYYSDNYYTPSSASYYYNGGVGINPNHAVTIVGWDDNYSKSNFTKQPPGNGAFIIKNSWGPYWGQSGFFYMSYYDSFAGNEAWAFDDAEATTNYSKIYQLDPLGWVENFTGQKPSTTEWAANIFTGVSSDPLEAVSFYASYPNMSYEIDIYTGSLPGKPASGNAILSQTGTLTNVGYETIVLNTPVPMMSGMLFTVVIKFTATSVTYPVPVQCPMPGYASKAPCVSGTSFVSPDGKTWSEISTNTYKSTACIKAFAGGSLSPNPTPTPTPVPTFTVTATASTGGTLTPAGVSTVQSKSNIVYTYKPSTGYIVSSLTIDGAKQSTVSSTGGTYTFPSITSNHTIAVAFAIPTYPIQATTGPNGTVTPLGVTTVNSGGSQVYTIKPNTGYKVYSVTVDGTNITTVPSTGGTYTFQNVTVAHTISAIFQNLSYTVTATAGANGTITPSGTATLAYGTSPTYTIKPNTGYQVATATVNGVNVTVPSSGGTITLQNISASYTIAVTFKPVTVTVTATANANGTITPSGVSMYNYGNSTTYTIKPNTGYVISGVTIDGVTATGVVNTGGWSYTFSNLTTNHLIVANFAKTYTVTASATSNGTITPSGVTTVVSGGSSAFVIKPNSGHTVYSVLLNGASTSVPSTGGTVTLSNIQSNQTLSVTFK